MTELVEMQNLHQILCSAWIFLHRNYSASAESHSYGQLVIGSFIPARSRIASHAEFFGETSNHSGDSAPLQPRFGTLQLLAFPKTIIIFEKEEISDHQWDSGKYNRAADGNWENCGRSQGPYFEGDWGIIFLCTMFLICSSINVSFSYYMSGYLWTDLIYFAIKRY